MTSSGDLKLPAVVTATTTQELKALAFLDVGQEPPPHPCTVLGVWGLRTAGAREGQVVS